MKFDSLAKTWECFGRTDPMWAILAWEGKDQGRWNPKDFFRVGREEVEFVFNQVKARHQLKNHEASLDFGCGVGRLTLPLGSFFKSSHGVDISSEMIRQAEKFRDARLASNCIYHHNAREDLSIFADESFDFILSLIVLQHMEPCFFKTYIKEFIRVLKKGGMLVFQLPDATENRADYEEFEDDSTPVMEMYGSSAEEIKQLITDCGGTVVDVIEDQSCGPDLKSFRYFITK